jgi:hypothetical protein
VTCITPPEIDDITISAVIDGTADADTHTHLEACAHCQSLVEQAARTEALLNVALYRWQCPPPADLRDYEFGRLAEGETAFITHHLSGCQSCRAELTQLQNFVQRGPTPTPPARPRLDPVSILREVIATLLPGSSQPAYALRGDAPKPVMAQAEDVMLFIEMIPNSVGYTLNGQVTAADMAEWEGALVQLQRGGKHLATARVQEGGMFSTTPVTPGPLTVRLTAKTQRVIVLPDLEPTT